jgi:hypothetical protein
MATSKNFPLPKLNVPTPLLCDESVCGTINTDAPVVDPLIVTVTSVTVDAKEPPPLPLNVTVLLSAATSLTQNSKIRLLLSSATQRLPCESNPTPVGSFIPFWVVARVLLMKSVWPSTNAALLPFAQLLVAVHVNSKTRSFQNPSATQRLPCESNPTPVGSFIPFWVVTPPEFVVKSGSPSTSAALLPFEQLLVAVHVNSKTRLFSTSATQRSPCESNPTPVGRFIPFWLVAAVPLVKLD